MTIEIESKFNWIVESDTNFEQQSEMMPNPYNQTLNSPSTHAFDDKGFDTDDKQTGDSYEGNSLSNSNSKSPLMGEKDMNFFSVREQETKIIVSGLTYQTAELDLLSYFERFGDVKSVEIQKDPRTLISIGIGIVIFTSNDTISKLLSLDSRNHVIDGKNVEVHIVDRKLRPSHSFQGQSASINRLRENHSFTSGSTKDLFGRENLPKLYIDQNDKTFYKTDTEKLERTQSMRYMSSQTSQTNSPLSPLAPSVLGFHTPQGNIIRSHSHNSQGQGTFNFNVRRPTFPSQSPTAMKRQSNERKMSLKDYQQYGADYHNFFQQQSSSNIGKSPQKLNAHLSEDEAVIVPNKIFVGGLLYATGHESLRKYFETFGEVESAEVIYNRETKKSRGFGFVIFKEFSSVEIVLERQKVGGLLVDGKQVEIKLCKAREDTVAEILNANAQAQAIQRSLSCGMPVPTDFGGYSPQFRPTVDVNEPRMIRYGSEANFGMRSAPSLQRFVPTHGYSTPIMAQHTQMNNIRYDQMRRQSVQIQQRMDCGSFSTKYSPIAPDDYVDNLSGDFDSLKINLNAQMREFNQPSSGLDENRSPLSKLNKVSPVLEPEHERSARKSLIYQRTPRPNDVTYERDYGNKFGQSRMYVDENIGFTDFAFVNTKLPCIHEGESTPINMATY